MQRCICVGVCLCCYCALNEWGGIVVDGDEGKRVRFVSATGWIDRVAGGTEKGSESESCHAQGLIGLLPDRY